MRAFKDAKLLCVSPSYLVEWVAHPWAPLGPQHRRFGTLPGRALAALEAGRGGGGEGGDEDGRSMSF